MSRQTCWCFLLLTSTLALGAGPTLAHKVNLFAYVEGQTIKGEGYFAGWDKARYCAVVLQDEQGRELAATKTDQKGGFSLPRPSAPPPWRLVMAAGQGHQANYTLRAEDVRVDASSSQDPAAAPAKAGVDAPEVISAAAGLAADQLEELVGRVVEKRLDPIKAQLARLSGEQSLGLRDILGGLGYILGLMGLAAYLKARKG